jgi:hypothetical protein
LIRLNLLSKGINLAPLNWEKETGCSALLWYSTRIPTHQSQNFYGVIFFKVHLAKEMLFQDESQPFKLWRRLELQANYSLQWHWDILIQVQYVRYSLILKNSKLNLVKWSSWISYGEGSREFSNEVFPEAELLFFCDDVFHSAFTCYDMSCMYMRMCLHAFYK